MYFLLNAEIHPADGRVASVLMEIKSRTFKHPNDLFQTYFTVVFSKWHSFYGIKSLGNT